MDFNLEQLTSIYIRSFAPEAYDRASNTNKPVYVIYEGVMKFLDQPDERARKLRNDIMGYDATVPQSYKERYNDIGMATSLGIDLIDWDTYPIREKAQLRAKTYLKNMIDVVNAFYKEQDRLLEKHMKGN